jgi:phenylalanyl-tRNA synthetase beta chain
VSDNLNVQCPQKIFEIGKITVLDEKSETGTRDEDRLAAVIYDANAGFTEAKSALESFMMNLGLEWQMKGTEHPSFISGRTAMIISKGAKVGILGEINPKVLETWKLENPAAVFELDIGEIIRIGRKQ